jgi:hypothetical protein
MRNSALFCTLAVGLLCCSCNPKVSTLLFKEATPLDVNKVVAVIELDETLPSNSEILGTVEINDAVLTTNCSYEYVLELAKAQARKAGGNTLKITQHEKPDMYTSCHRISAQILLIDTPISRQNTQKALSSSDSINSQLVAENGPMIKRVDPRMRFSLYGGLSEFLVFDPEYDDPVIEQYSNELKSGYSVGADYTYYISDSYGLGLTCNMNRTTNSLSGVTIYTDNGYRRYGTISDDIMLFYVGPTFNLRSIGYENKGTLFLSVSAGYNGYYNRACVINRFIAYGATLGSSFDFGYDVNLSKKLALGLKLSLTTGLLNKLTINDGYTIQEKVFERGSYMSLNHINLSVGLSFVK